MEDLSGIAMNGMRAGIARMDVAAHDAAMASVSGRPESDIDAGDAPEPEPLAPVDRQVVLRERTPGVTAEVAAAQRPPRLADEMVQMTIAGQEVAANAAVARTAADTYRSVTDLLDR